MIRISLFLRKIAWMAALIAMSASCVLMLLVLVGGFGGNFLPVFANLILLIVCLGVLGGGVVLLALKKRAFYVRYAPAVLVGFTVYLLINLLGLINLFGGVDNGLCIATAVMVLLELLGLIAALVLFGIAAFNGKPNLLPIARIVALGSCAFGIVPMILAMVVYGQNNFPWTSFVEIIGLCLFYPAAATFVMIYAGNLIEEIEAPVEEPKEEPKEAEVVEAEEVKEEPAEEPAPEEKPEEEKPEEKKKPAKAKKK